MLSKLLKSAYTVNKYMLLTKKIVPPVKKVKYSDYLPKSQYDVPFPKRLRLGWAMRVYWEIIPLILVTAFSVSLGIAYSIWCTMHKVDVVFDPRHGNRISRTMDLRKPTIHKVFTINQQYEPWPEMQDVLDRMCVAERALSRSSSRV